MEVSNHIDEILKNLPNKSGVYQYFDKNETIIYVGKAKFLKKRVKSYFTKKQENIKTRILVDKIYDIKYIVVSTEMDALLLENNLIKKYKPRYNVLLKDDKTYPWICIKNEPFPRVFQTRKVLKDGSEYFGPYASTYLVKIILEFFRQLYPLRNCNFNLSEKNVQSNKFKVCLEYHMKNCLGPCVGKQNNNNYLKSINQIRKIISGDIKSVIKHLRDEMNNFSNNLDFENAHITKEKLILLQNYQSKSTIVNPKINNVDVFTIISDENAAFVNFLKINSGAIIQSYTLEINKQLNETEEELLLIAIIEIRQKFNSTSKDIYCSHYLKEIQDDINIIVPKIGDKRSLIDLGIRNAKYMLLEKRKAKINNIKRTDNNRILIQLQRDLKLRNLPKHIECFDNSNIQGNFPVAACVVFKNARSNKKEYRNYNIKTVSGPDDYASMQEVVFRRYSRILKENGELPQLIVIDGGRGQLSSAMKSINKLKLTDKITVIGIAKRLEEIYFYDDNIPIYLDKRSESLKLIQQLRDEAHRFGIKHHRNKRSKKALETSLDKIKGIGPKTIELLISEFGSVKKVKEATKTDLIKLVGIKKTDKILAESK
jgi:excinuclease ABC subunit C